MVLVYVLVCARVCAYQCTNYMICACVRYLDYNVLSPRSMDVFHRHSPTGTHTLPVTVQ